MSDNGEITTDDENDSETLHKSGFDAEKHEKIAFVCSLPAELRSLLMHAMDVLARHKIVPRLW
jgi:hypothetical protein